MAVSQDAVSVKRTPQDELGTYARVPRPALKSELQLANYGANNPTLDMMHRSIRGSDSRTKEAGVVLLECGTMQFHSGLKSFIESWLD
ncbi:hypothetical protein ACLMJK_003430 [Lecanora helva]